MNKKRNVMVCVTQQKTCERLIKRGHINAQKDEDNLFVVHVVSENDSFLHNSNEGQALEYLFAVSRESGADLTVIRAKDVIGAIGDFAKKNKITHIVLGASPHISIENHPIAKRLKKLISNVEYDIV